MALIYAVEEGNKEIIELLKPKLLVRLKSIKSNKWTIVSLSLIIVIFAIAIVLISIK